jgi:hypothetical protein
MKDRIELTNEYLEVKNAPSLALAIKKRIRSGKKREGREG